jgi:hypothetical protein
MVLNVEYCHLGIGDALASWIVTTIEERSDDQGGRRLGAANEGQDGIPSSQWHAGLAAPSGV